MKKKRPTERREFLKSVAAAGSGLAAGKISSDEDAVVTQAKKPIQKRPVDQNALTYPRAYTGRQLRMIAFPLGGVGAGSISLGGRGQLRDWEVFNRSDKGRAPKYAFASIWAQREGEKPFASILESQLMPPYEGSSGLGTNNAPGLPRLESATFTGEFPLAQIDFADSKLPLKVSLEAFSPFIPHEADDSGLPVAVLRYRVSNPGRLPVKVSIAFSIDNPVGVQGRKNEFKQGGGLSGLLMRNTMMNTTDPQAGTFALSAIDSPESRITYLRGWNAKGWNVGPLLFWDDFSGDGELTEEEASRDSIGSLCLQKTLKPREKTDFTFLLGWHFPNRTPAFSKWSAAKGEENTIVGNFYSTRFADAWAAVEYATSKLEVLEKRTRQFAEIVRRTTLPAGVVDAAMSNLSTLVTQTCFRTADGEFHGFEGCNDQGGCCFGNCTHVWNYETATAHLFPQLSRSLRGNAFGFCTDEKGLQDFRQLLPAKKQRWGRAAADGQMGQVMKLYLDWLLSGDDEWLRGHWPAAKRALEFAWVPGGWDADKDGVMEGVQHNTYDVEFYGPNPLCGVYYLGALRAGEEMARAVNDSQSAAEYRRLFEQGSKWIDANLFNGEYYIQKIQGQPKDKIAAGLLVGMGSADTMNPDFQLGDGCLVDQLLGQYVADIAGLGPQLKPENIRKTLGSIYKYNYKRNLYDHESVQRVYALNDEAALVICDYGRGSRPKIPFPYHAEVMTGFEYSVAILMLYQGMVAEGVELIENIRRRYDGERRNPWNEAECGHHYARAMASWAAIPALSGFGYDGREKRVTAMPAMNRASFSSFWSNATAWGSFNQKTGAKRSDFSLDVAGGSLNLKSIHLDLASKSASGSVVRVGDKAIAHQLRRENGIARIVLNKEIRLEAGDRLTVTL